MINIIQYLQDTHFVKPLFLIGLGITVHDVLNEIIAYSLDRIISRMIAKCPYQNQLFSEQLKQINLAETIIQNLSFYFCFQYFFLRYGLEFNTNLIIKQELKSKINHIQNFVKILNFIQQRPDQQQYLFYFVNQVVLLIQNCNVNNQDYHPRNTGII